MSSSVRSAAPRRRRSALDASSICAMSSTSFWLSTSGDRVGRQSSTSAPERGE
jgi:hypothetical protein